VVEVVGVVGQRLRPALRVLAAVAAVDQAASIYFCARPIYQAALRSQLETEEPQALARP
jgi:hypothetical protein